MQQLMDTIRTNYEGYEDIRKALLDARKYGNGNDYVDDILTQLYGQWDEAWIFPFRPMDGALRPPGGGTVSASAFPSSLRERKPTRAHMVCSGRLLRCVLQFSICRPKKEAAVSASARSVSPAVLSAASVMNNTQPMTSP